MTEEYRVDLKCYNCKKISWYVKIPKGKSVEDHCEGELCKHCNCPIIRVKEKKE